MNNNLLTELRLEKTNMYSEINAFAKAYKLNSKAKQELLALMELRIDVIIHKFDNSRPFASIKRFE